MKKPESRKTEDLILLVTKTTALAPRCEDRLSPHDALGDTGRDPKMLECMKAILEETKALDQRLVALDGTTQALVDGAYKHGSNACHIADQAEAIRGRYVDLRQQLEERCAALQVVFEAAAELLEVLKSVTVDLSSLEQEFDSMEAPARMLPVVQTQLDQITNMEKHILKLEERSKARNDELERVLGKLESFYGPLDKVLINIEEEFCEKLRNSLEETVLESNTGQGLVQSAAPGEHNLLHEEIVAKRSGFETLSDTASALMILVGDKAACGLADKVAYITDHYVDVPTSHLEMEAVANMFDRNPEGYIPTGKNLWLHCDLTGKRNLHLMPKRSMTKSSTKYKNTHVEQNSEFIKSEKENRG
ncbi:hypothetical protein QYM36_019690, partial [Artemia franciscana]